MSARRGDVIRTLHSILAAYAPLTDLLDGGSAGVLGSTASVEDGLPLPCLVLGMGVAAPAQQGDEWTWDIAVDAFAADVFDLADVLDELEDACLEYRSSASHPILLAQLLPGNADDLGDALPGLGYRTLAAARLTVTARWVAQ